MIENRCSGTVQVEEWRLTGKGGMKKYPMFKDCENMAFPGDGRFCTACLKSRGYWVLLMYSTALTVAGAVGALAWWGLK